jgi:hypothetical protein
VHITSKDPTAAPIIDPNYFSHPLDAELFSGGVLFLQYLATILDLNISARKQSASSVEKR